MSTHFWWYLSRASGIVAWAMLTASVMWGIFLSTKMLRGRKRPAWVLDLHKWLAVLTMIFLTLHIAALMLNSYSTFTVADVLLPFHSSYQISPTAFGGRLAVAMGVLSMWALVVVEGTSLAMKRMARSTWHSIHLASYGIFWIGSIHGLLVGTDASHLLYIWSSVATLAMVAFASAYRVLTKKRSKRSTEHGPNSLRNTHLEGTFG